MTAVELDRSSLEAETREARTARLAWLETRRSGLGGSDMAGVAGLSPYSTAWSVYHDKVGPVVDDSAGEAARWGTLLEDVVVREWFLRVGHELGEGLHRSELLRDPVETWRVGTPDRLLVNDGDVALAVVEVKLAGPEAWRYQWNGGANVPAWYLVQVQHYLALTGLHRAYVVVLVEGRRLEWFPIDRDDKAIARLTELGRSFWLEHVIPQIPPPPDGRSSTRDALDDLYAAQAETVACRLPAEAEELVEAYTYAGLEERAASARKAEAANRLIALLGEAEATDGYLASAGDGDPPAVTYRARRELDVRALRKEVGRKALRGLWRTTLDTKAVEKALGKKTVDRHRRPGTSRTLRVRSTD